MSYDSGEVLPGLNDPWTFMGANAMEWASGLVVFLMVSLFADSPATAMPFMLMGWLMTTISLASMRGMFPDEERGVRNSVMTACGFPPPGIPAPARIQPMWSASPMREVSEKTKFAKLGLDNLFPSFEREQEPDEYEDL